jgi:hypothetical protein
MSGIGLFELLEDFKDAVSAFNRLINNKFEVGCVLKNDGAANERLDSLAFLFQ